jgi:hypothetical protein
VTTDTIRFSTFNASLNRNSEGQLVTDLSTSDNIQAQTVAEIIQRTNPDVILIKRQFGLSKSRQSGINEQRGLLRLVAVGDQPADQVD